MINHFLEQRGFIYGGGQISPDHLRFIVFVPKNASSTLGEWTHQHGWSAALVGSNDVNWTEVKEMIVVMRDPQERWISGMIQYLKSYIIQSGQDAHISSEKFVALYNDLTESLIMDMMCRFDDHVWPQHEYFQDLLPDVPRKFFLFGPGLTKEISQHVSIPDTELRVNQGDPNHDSATVKGFLQERLRRNSKMVERLREVYKEDYSIIDRYLQK